MRTGTGCQKSAVFYQFHGTQINLSVSFYCILNRISGLGKCRILQTRITMNFSVKFEASLRKIIKNFIFVLSCSASRMSFRLTISTYAFIFIAFRVLLSSFLTPCQTLKIHISRKCENRTRSPPSQWQVLSLWSMVFIWSKSQDVKVSKIEVKVRYYAHSRLRIIVAAALRCDAYAPRVV